MRSQRRIPRDILFAAGAVASMLIGGAVTVHAAPPTPTPDQDSAEWTVTDGYFLKQSDCTPDTPGDPLSITWDPPGFPPGWAERG